jgi:hypothetical protein
VGEGRRTGRAIGSNDPPYGREMGSTMLRGYVCRVNGAG